MGGGQDESRAQCHHRQRDVRSPSPKSCKKGPESEVPKGPNRWSVHEVADKMKEVKEGPSMG